MPILTKKKKKQQYTWYFDDYLKRHFGRYHHVLRWVTPLTNLSTYPTYAFWSLLWFAQFTFPVMLILCAIACLLSIVVLAIEFLSIRAADKKTQAGMMKYVVQLALPHAPEALLAIADDILPRLKADRIHYLKEACTVASYMFYFLLSAYYILIHNTLLFFGCIEAAFAMTTPIALSIALIGFFVIALAMGYQQYQQARKDRFCVLLEEKLETVSCSRIRV